MTDAEAMNAFSVLCRAEGIIPAIESAHALAGVLDVGRELGPDGLILVNLSGRGCRGRRHRLQVVRGVTHVTSAVTEAFGMAARTTARPWSATCPPGSPPWPAPSRPPWPWRRPEPMSSRWGCRSPPMDGPVIAEAVHRALAAGSRVADALRTVEAVAAAGVPVLVMTYWNPVDRYGVRAFARDLAAAGLAPG